MIHTKRYNARHYPSHASNLYDFNRLGTVARVFVEVAKAQPPMLLLAGDDFRQGYTRRASRR
jgi:hypothetical protein